METKDQPEKSPVTHGKWMPEQIQQIRHKVCEKTGGSYGSCEVDHAIAGAVNEKQQRLHDYYQGIVTENQKLREQLAAEREKIKKLEQEIENLHLHISVK